MLEIKINLVDNGCILESDDIKMLYKFDKENKEDIKSMFFDILYLIGMPNSKHNKQNVKIEIEKNQTF